MYITQHDAVRGGSGVSRVQQSIDAGVQLSSLDILVCKAGGRDHAGGPLDAPGAAEPLSHRGSPRGGADEASALAHSCGAVLQAQGM